MVQAANNASTHHSRLRFTIIVISPWGKWVERQVRESAECRAVGFVAVAEQETPALRSSRCEVSPWRCSRLRAGTRDCGRRYCRRSTAACRSWRWRPRPSRRWRCSTMRCSCRPSRTRSEPRPPASPRRSDFGPSGAAASAGRAAASADVSPARAALGPAARLRHARATPPASPPRRAAAVCHQLLAPAAPGAPADGALPV